MAAAVDCARVDWQRRTAQVARKKIEKKPAIEKK